MRGNRNVNEESARFRLKVVQTPTQLEEIAVRSWRAFGTGGATELQTKTVVLKSDQHNNKVGDN